MITILIGKSASGKNCIQNKLIKKGLERIVTYTTRPKRDCEQDGVDYYFINEKEFFEKPNSNYLIEWTKYDTMINGKQGSYYYGSSDIGLDKNKDYVIVLDPVGAKKWKDKVDNCKVVYVKADKEIREIRARLRGNFNKQEWDRREKADYDKFVGVEDWVDEIIENEKGVVNFDN